LFISSKLVKTAMSSANIRKYYDSYVKLRKPLVETMNTLLYARL